MTRFTFIRRSLWHHARSHLGTLLGVTVGTAILTGALLVGDSVRGSLRSLALARLGETEVALAGGDRFFRSALAVELADRLGVVVAPMIQLDATASTPDDRGRANGIQLLAMDERFWRLASKPPDFPSPDADEVLLNETLARQLGVEPGATIILRVARPSSLSRETPLSPQEDAVLTLRLTVAALVPQETLGLFSLQPSQLPRFNAFVHLGTLQERLQLPGRANLLLATGDGLTPESINAGLRKTWQLNDAELELRVLPERPMVELRTSRVFLDSTVTDAAIQLDPGAQPILTYFVNDLATEDRAAPYSMVTAAGPPIVPSEVGPDEIVINDWLAQDLEVKPGDSLELRYFTLGMARRLDESSARFRIHSVVPMDSSAADRELMPEFPGIEKAESTRDWDPTLPVSMDRIRPQDEVYWQEYRGTPKAFLPLGTGQALWTNRFGDLTAIRFPASAAGVEATREELAIRLRDALAPESFGLRFEPVREQALASANQSQDFGGLFLGFSLFLIVAALLLVALLFQFGIERRGEEIGTLLALGFLPGQVRRLLLGEAVGLAMLGGLAGMAAGTFYARAMIQGLATLWRDAVGTSALAYHGSAGSLAMGAVAGTIVAVLAIALALRKQVRRPARDLLAGGDPGHDANTFTRTWRTRNRQLWLASVCLGAGFALALQALVRAETASAGTFFGAGALWLAGGVLGCAILLRWLNVHESARRLSLVSLGIRNTGRRLGRSVAVVALLGCGSFLVAAIGVFRLDAVRDADARASGTGGFALIGEATFPVVQDLNTAAGLEFFALDQRDLPEVSFVPLRVRDGDEASCLNLNRARQPRLLGVDPALLAKREAFVFAQVAKGLDRGQGWNLLPSPEAPAADSGSEVVPAIGDLNSILWAMGLKVGDRMTYTDERGRPFQVHIVGAVANSILQGNLLIDERAFLRLYPSEPGYRMFLVDAPPQNVDDTAARLTRGLGSAGVEFTPSTVRLNAFNAVQNTYLGTFQLLGGLGLILGSIGLGVLVLRNVLERRGELALLLAVGFRPRAVRRMVMAEHAGLLVAGLGVGMVAAALAVLPNLLSPTAQVPYYGLALTLGGVLISGLVWTWLASATALRGRLLDGLRNE